MVNEPQRRVRGEIVMPPGCPHKSGYALPLPVMPGFMPGIHVFDFANSRWKAGTSSAMTNEVSIASLGSLMHAFRMTVYAASVFGCKAGDVMAGTSPAMTIACGSAAGHQLRPGTSPAMTKIVRRDDKPGRDG